MAMRVDRRSEYQGPDRRRHRVFVTNNSEYHCRDSICVAVRDRATRRFAPQHRAIGQPLDSSIRFNDEGGIASVSRPDQVAIGEKLLFSTPLRDEDGDFVEPTQIITSVLTAVERPTKETVATYPTEPDRHQVITKRGEAHAR